MTLDTFGAAFKELRTQRGYSQKEAAGDICTPQHLGKFERGESAMMIDHFNRLLISIGVTWEDFFEVYEGVTVSKVLDNYWIEINSAIQVSDFYKIKQLVKKDKVAVPDNPFLTDLKELVFEVLIAKRWDNPTQFDKDAEHLEPLKNHLTTIDKWGRLEEFIYSKTQELFPPEFNKYRTYKYLESFKQHPIDYVKGDRNVIFLIFLSIAYFSKSGLFAIADNLIEEMETILQSDTYIDFLHEKISLKVIKANHLLRQNKVEGLELAKQVVQIEKMFLDHCYCPQYFIGINAFINHVNTLNKTGIPFDPY